MTNNTATPAPTTRARRIARELSRVTVPSFWFFDFKAEGDYVVCVPNSDACLCTYAFPRTWGVKRIDWFLMERVNYGE
jgi:hypothetical protein